MSQPISNPQVQQLLHGRIETPRRPNAPAAGEFAALLEDRLKLSSHAQTRLASRNIELSGEDWRRVLDGVDRAAAKGARESLVLLDQAALVVSVRNRTVITAVDREQLKENVFTNIDSAVIV